MVQGTTKSGFEFNIDESKFALYKYVRIVRKVDKGELQYVVDLAEFILEDDVEKLYDHLGEDATTNQIQNELMDIITKVAELKNS